MLVCHGLRGVGETWLDSFGAVGSYTDHDEIEKKVRKEEERGKATAAERATCYSKTASKRWWTSVIAWCRTIRYWRWLSPCQCQWGCYRQRTWRGYAHTVSVKNVVTHNHICPLIPFNVEVTFMFMDWSVEATLGTLSTDGFVDGYGNLDHAGTENSRLLPC